MQYGDLVDPIFLANHGWRFVVADSHDISRKVREEWSDSRIVGWPPNGNLAVAVWVPRSELGEDVSDIKQTVQASGGAWVLSMRLMDPQTGEPRRRLESDVLTEMRRKDTHRRRRNVDPRTLFNQLEAADERRKESQMALARDARLAAVEEVMFRAARQGRIPWNPSRIYVPGK